jgi:hypothetical protein
MARLLFTDYAGTPLEVGSEVTYGDEQGVIVALGEPDGDYNDELGRAVEITPSITVEVGRVQFEVETMNVTRVTWADYPDGPSESTYQADDLEAVS